ncbi:MAG: helix-turn-helix domain-containing protein [Desertimonas sp.]
MTAVAAAVGWSRRYLGQWFLDEFGMTPKTVGRVARFQHAAATLKRTPAEPSATVAAAAVGA